MKTHRAAEFRFNHHGTPLKSVCQLNKRSSAQYIRPNESLRRTQGNHTDFLRLTDGFFSDFRKSPSFQLFLKINKTT